MRFGLITPILSLLPGTPEWERDGSPADLAAIARAADALGFDYLTCSEHVGIPAKDAPVRGARYYDPLASLGFIAAITERIKLLSHVVVLPYHAVIALAKQYGTLDALSGGRVVLGVGVGSLKPEFELLGADFEGRGPRYEEGLAALRAALGQREPSFEGTYHRFGGFVIDPCAVQERVPIWLGGRTPRSLRRAVELGDGWAPFGLALDEIAELLRKAPERTRPFDVALPLIVPADGDASAVASEVEKLRDAGATVASLTVRSRSAAHYVERLEWLMREVAPRVG